MSIVDKQAEVAVDIIGKANIKSFDQWERHYILYSAIEQVRSFEGNFVQCGVHNGEQSFFIASNAKSTVYLFDSFEGITSVGEFDNEFYKENAFKPDREIFDKNISTFENVSINSLTELDKVEKISLLYVDLATYEPTKNVLENLFYKIVDGGILMVDTHDNYSTGAAKAIHDLAVSIGKQVQTLPAGILVITR
jgi:hypothetical protein